MDTPAELIHRLGGEERIVFNVDRSLPPAFEDAISLVGQLEIQGERVVVHGKNDQANLVSEVVSQLTKQEIQFRDLRTEQSTLEDVFLKLTGHEMKD
jgi:ABC-2 type transport system ATP-binding protein